MINLLGINMLQKIKPLGFASLIAVLAAANATAQRSYYDENTMLFKVRGIWALTDGKQSNFPAPSSRAGKANPKTPGNLFNTGFGVEGATTFFLNSNFAAEFSLGAINYKVKSTSVSDVEYNFNNNPRYTRGKNAYAIPATVTAQYHFAPYGAIRPYAGAGYHAVYMLPKAKGFKLKHGHGPVMQAGVDFVFQDDTYFNIDIKKYFLRTDVKYKSNVATTSTGGLVKGKLKLDPLTIAAGFGWKF